MVYPCTALLILTVNSWIRPKLSNPTGLYPLPPSLLNELLLFYDLACLESTTQSFRTLKIGDIDLISCMKSISHYNRCLLDPLKSKLIGRVLISRSTILYDCTMRQT